MPEDRENSSEQLLEASTAAHIDFENAKADLVTREEGLMTLLDVRQFYQFGADFARAELELHEAPKSGQLYDFRTIAVDKQAVRRWELGLTTVNDLKAHPEVRSDITVLNALGPIIYERDCEKRELDKLIAEKGNHQGDNVISDGIRRQEVIIAGYNRAEQVVRNSINLSRQGWSEVNSSSSS